jgi:hypothetical protein
MSYVNLEDRLGRIVGEEGKEKEAVEIRLALGRYNDLHGFLFQPTNEVLLCSGQVNQFATHVRIERQDNQFVALPYIEDIGIRLHSSATVFFLGFDNPNGFGIVPYCDWEEHLKKALIPIEIINKIKSFLDNHPPVDYL